MNVLLTIDDSSLPVEQVAAALGGHPEWWLAPLASADELGAHLSDDGVNVLLVPPGIEWARAQPYFEQAHRQLPLVRTVCVYEPAQEAHVTAMLEKGFDECLALDVARSPQLAAVLGGFIVRWRAAERSPSPRSMLERRNRELVALNVLANAVTSSLDRTTVLERAIWVFRGVLTTWGRVAYFELVEPDEEGARRDGAGEEPKLVCLATTADEGEEDIIDDEDLRRLVELVQDDRIEIVNVEIEPPAAGDDARDGTGDRNGTGEAMRGQCALIPVWSAGKPLGLLMLYERTAETDTSFLFSHDSLHAMARLFGASLQNVALFDEVHEAYSSLQQAQAQLVHAEKFAAFGVLSAEIAHEINNPASFVISNLSVMLDYVATLGGFFDAVHEAAGRRGPAEAAGLRALEEQFEIGFLREDLNTLLNRSLAGMQRIHQIVQDLRYFANESHQEPGWVDLEQLIEAAINLVRHEARFRARLELDFEGVPHVFSDANRLSQVLLNLLVNAAQAIAPGDVENNHIRVTTRRRGDTVVVGVEDTGCGIPEAVMKRLFEPFFTSKERGSGTGLGLPIAQDIIRGLGGEIRVARTSEAGTCFEFSVPIRAAKYRAKAELRESGSFQRPPRGPSDVFPAASGPVVAGKGAVKSAVKSAAKGGAKGAPADASAERGSGRTGDDDGHTPST